MESVRSTEVPALVRRLALWMPLAVAVAALALAGNLLYQFWGQADHLWYSWQHDRNAHYLHGLSIAMSVRSFDVVSLFREVERIQTWGLLHPLLESMVQLVAGPDYRLAVLPSLLGWVGCAVFGFLLVRRMSPRFGNLAGLATAAFILASPAHHAFAADIMLESLGACLSLATLYYYLVYVEMDTRRSAIWLAVSWSLLFYLKTNYWMLVTMSLVLSEAFRHRSAILRFLLEHRRDVVPTLGRQFRHPLTWLILVPTAIGIYVWKIAPITLGIGSITTTIRSFYGLAHFAFACLCLRTYLWWRAGGREWLATWPASQRVLVLGTVLPISFWFLMPKRLGRFLWYMSLENNSQPIENYVPFYGFRFYWKAYLDDYLVAPWLIWLVLGLTALAFVGCRRLTRGTGAVLLFMVIATVLTMHHPMLKNRLMHSWAAGYWVAAGAGFALCLTALARVHRHLAPAVGTACVAALAAYMGPAFLSPGHAQEAGVRLDHPVFFEITSTWQPHVGPGQKVQILCSDTEAFGLKWAQLQRVSRPRLVGLDIPGFNSAQQDPQVLHKWLQGTKVDALVLVDIAEGSRFWEGAPAVSLPLLEGVLREHGGFQCSRQWNVAKGEKVSLWTRTTVAAAPE